MIVFFFPIKILKKKKKNSYLGKSPFDSKCESSEPHPPDKRPPNLKHAIWLLVFGGGFLGGDMGLLAFPRGSGIKLKKKNFGALLIPIKNCGPGHPPLFSFPSLLSLFFRGLLGAGGPAGLGGWGGLPGGRGRGPQREMRGRGGLAWPRSSDGVALGKGGHPGW